MHRGFCPDFMSQRLQIVPPLSLSSELKYLCELALCTDTEDSTIIMRFADRVEERTVTQRGWDVTFAALREQSWMRHIVKVSLDPLQGAMHRPGDNDNPGDDQLFVRVSRLSTTSLSTVRDPKYSVSHRTSLKIAEGNLGWWTDSMSFRQSVLGSTRTTTRKTIRPWTVRLI